MFPIIIHPLIPSRNQKVTFPRSYPLIINSGTIGRTNRPNALDTLIASAWLTPINRLGLPGEWIYTYVCTPYGVLRTLNGFDSFFLEKGRQVLSTAGPSERDASRETILYWAPADISEYIVHTV